jgi:thiamine-phosphate pyrophosphorylase
MLRYAITDLARVSGDASAREAALLRQAARLAAEGVDYLQLREKDLAPGTLAALARKLLGILRSSPHGPKLLINSRADIAVATQADGVHLTSELGGLTPADIRRLYASAGLPEPVVSVSCHSLNDVAHIHDSKPALILFGPVFEKVVAHPGELESSLAIDTRLSEGIGLNLLHLACAAAAPTPVLALGGITMENAPACLAAGAAGIAAIRLFQDESREALSTNRH